MAKSNPASGPAKKPAAKPATKKPAAKAAEPVYKEIAAPAASEPAASIEPRPVAGKIISSDDIARRAYELYQQGHPGSEVEHWLEAEKQLKQ
jgi:hypothetical protein